MRKKKKLLLSLSFVLAVLYTQVHALAHGPLIHENDIVYVGSFRVPKEGLGTIFYSTLSYGGAPMAFDPVRKGLFIFGHPYGKLLAEISIPEPVNSLDIEKLPTASVLQTTTVVTDAWDNLRPAGDPVIGSHGVPGGIILFGDKLIGSAYVYYDAGGHNGYLSHYSASPNWSNKGINFKGFYHIGDKDLFNGGTVGGYMALVPPDWKDELGAPVLTGLGGISIISRSSFGPCAWIFDPSDLGAEDTVPAKMLVGYPEGHTTLGNYTHSTIYYNGATAIRGLVFPYNTSSVLFFGVYGYGPNGDGTFCYGEGTDDPTLNGKSVPGEDGVVYCYDPYNSAKGEHAYPYAFRVWAYDANDLLKVKRGEINPSTGEPYKPWDLKPYAIWDLKFPLDTHKGQMSCGAVAYYPQTQRIFVSEPESDKVGYGKYPLIHVFKVTASPEDAKVPSPPGTLHQAP